MFLGDISYTTSVSSWTLSWRSHVLTTWLFVDSWKAFIYWAYFEEFQFAPLKSEQKQRQKDQMPGAAPVCSPKSMYRIAHKVGTRSSLAYILCMH